MAGYLLDRPRIISCLRNQKQSTRNCVLSPFTGSAGHDKLSFTFGGYCRMPQTSAPSTLSTDVAGPYVWVAFISNPLKDKGLIRASNMLVTSGSFGLNI